MKILVISSQCDKVDIPKTRIDIISWNSNKLGPVNLRDYDGVVFDMSDYYSDPYDDYPMRSIFEKYSISSEIVYDILKKPNTFIIIIGNPNTKIKNKKLLDSIGFSVSSEMRSGDTIINARYKDQPFDRYLVGIKKYSYFLHEYIEISNSVNKLWRSGVSGYTMNGVLIPLLKNRADKILAAKLEPFRKLPSQSPIEKITPESISIDSPVFVNSDISRNKAIPIFGDIYLLPSNDEISKNDMITEILECYLGKEKSEPMWAREIKIQGQNILDKKLKEISGKISELTEEKNRLINDINTMRKPIEILWKSDIALEKSVERVLELMGANIDKHDTIENAVDCSFSYKTMNFAVEIKSTTKQMIDKKGLRQIRDWVEDLSDNGKEFKGLLIVSNEINKNYIERSSAFLPDNLIKYAEAQKIVAISVKTLYDKYCLMLKKPEKREDFFKCLYNYNGVFEK